MFGAQRQIDSRFSAYRHIRNDPLQQQAPRRSVGGPLRSLFVNKVAMVRYTILSLFLLIQLYPCCRAGDSTTTSTSSSSSILDDLFPPYEEYDANILDPLHGFGSPYGGFSRATRRRLAALPLPLPDLTLEDEEGQEWDPLYTTVRDGTTGQLYACRVYHQDELMPQSLVDSMYAPPVIRKGSQAQSGESPSTEMENKEEIMDQEQSPSTEMEMENEEEINEEESMETEQGGSEKEQEGREFVLEPHHAMKMIELTKRLDALKGLCGQIHKGWWSYEWCNESTMAQFHVAIDKDGGRVELQDITNLGDFQRREWKYSYFLEDSDRNPLARGLKEAARVKDYHEGGTICPETGKPRQTLVNIICCSEDIIARKKNMVRKGDSALANGDFAVYDIVEYPHQVCHYNVTICTPLLCEKEDEVLTIKATSSLLDSQEETRNAYKENESIMEILDRTLGGHKPVCLQSITGGWWNFEFCHGKSIRQYHEVVGTKRDKNGVSQSARIVETDHNLGRPQVSVFQAIVPEDEWRFVVNATDNKGGKKPYFELEYTNGDLCDDHDVRDAAIVAGNTGAKGLARSSSVRFSCGERYDITVNEDTSCHYVVNVVVPDLCRHPLFKTPVSKKQVFKCLPVDDPEVDADSILG